MPKAKSKRRSNALDQGQAKGGRSAGSKTKKTKKPKSQRHTIRKFKEDDTYIKTSDFSLSSLLKEPTWKKALKDLFKDNYVRQLEDLLSADYGENIEIFPTKDLVFNAFKLTPINQVKVVILGQDPYHNDDQAHGLSFSVPKGVAVPPSLKNIYKELKDDIEGFKIPEHGCLEKWAKEGVFLLNAFLTVEAHFAGSHAKYGWKQFTDGVIQKISDVCEGVVFILWGLFAQSKSELIDETKHAVLMTAHPSPMALNKFSGCRCFSKANELLISYGKEPVNWKL